MTTTSPVLLGLADAVLAMPSTLVATNFYLDDSDLEGNFLSTAAERRERLGEHLSAVEAGDLVLVGEAPGWQGARQSGVPFTSAAGVGLRGSKEPSATAVHSLLASVGMEERTLLWNAFPLHPHDLGKPRTNRTPRSAELDTGMDALRLAIAGRRIVCVGKTAGGRVGRLLGHRIPDIRHASHISPAIVVRHPSRGGALLFHSQTVDALSIWKLN
jgi:uracil-DNA glycosylase